MNQKLNLGDPILFVYVKIAVLMYTELIYKQF